MLIQFTIAQVKVSNDIAKLESITRCVTARIGEMTENDSLGSIPLVLHPVLIGDIVAITLLVVTICLLSP